MKHVRAVSSGLLLPLVLAAAACASSPAAAPPSAASPPPASSPPALAAAPREGAPAASAEATADDAAIEVAGRAWLDLRVDLSPEAATTYGIHTRDAELDDRSAAGAASARAREQAMLDDLRARFASPHASRAAQTDLALIMHRLAVDLEEERVQKPLERQPSAYLGPLNAIFLMISRDYAPASTRAANVVLRLEKIPAVVAAARANLKNPPRVWTQVAIEDARGAGAFFEQVRPFLASAGAGEADRTRAQRALATAKDAYARYATFLEKDVLPRSSGDFAAGRAFFDFLLRERYFLEEDADAVLALGKRLLERTDAQMTEVARRIDPSAKGWPEVTARLKRNHPSAKDLLPSYRRELDRARAFVVAKDVVALPPGDDCEVMETPLFMRSTVTAGYDVAPPFDTGITKGFFYVTPVDLTLSAAKQEAMLRENDHGDQVDTAVHEAYPGHHLQLSFARLHPSRVRKVSETSIFAEGWALYAEELLAELGYYTDEERLIQLEWALVRAARILIDVGLHTQGMSFDAALAILTDRVHLERPLAMSEIKRYTADPTQPLAYLVGREKIFAMRDRYQKREGSAFTLKRFHTEILSHGTIAPGLIAKEIFD